MIRFEEVSGDIVKLASSIQCKHFPELSDVKVKYLFDTKKRTRGDKLVLGRCQKTNELVKYFTIEEANDAEGYQYVISLDKITYNAIEDTDRIRLLRHELRHILVIETETKTHYKIYPHNIEDFVEEIELNQDDERWSLRVAQLVQDIYDQMEEKEDIGKE